jgi:P27 family predicted phage terminase small subunit
MTPIPHAPQRLRPPADLPAAETEIFISVVGGVDQQNFRPSDLPLLVEYCTAAVQAREAAAQLRREGSTIGRHINPLIAVQEKSVRAMAMLATKLRLSPQSRARVKLKPVAAPLSYYDAARLTQAEDDDASH